MPAKRTVIYVMADVRSGSTLLENILSKSDEVVSVGELALLKGHIQRKGPGAKWNWNCSCGKPVFECEFWGKVLQDVDTGSNDFNTSIAWNYRSKKILAGSLFSPVLKQTLNEISKRKNNTHTANTLVRIYNKIFDISGKNFIVDSSKDPVQAYAMYLNKPEDFDVKIVALTRDLRAIAASKKKWSIENKKQYKSLGKLLSNSLFYKKICSVITRIVIPENVVTVKYEKLATGTQRELDRITKKMGLQPFAAPQYMGVENNDHTIAGTPRRFTKQLIAYDNTWKQSYAKKPLLSFIGKFLNKV